MGVLYYMLWNVLKDISRLESRLHPVVAKKNPKAKNRGYGEWHRKGRRLCGPHKVTYHRCSSGVKIIR